MNKKTTPNRKTNKIKLEYNSSDYEPLLITYRVVDDGGYIVDVNENGEVYFDITDSQPKDDIIISIDVDGVVKEVSFTPVYFGVPIDGDIPVSIGDEVDFMNVSNYVVHGIDFEFVNLVKEIISGDEFVSVNNNVITFNDVGKVVVRVRISFVLDGEIHLMECIARFGVADAEVEPKIEKDTEKDIG